MHDPCTLCFDIKSPRKRRLTDGYAYRESLVSIWHVDPLKFDGKTGVRDDDSCGWFTPPLTLAQADTVRKIAKKQYRQIFEKAVCTRESASYAYICFDPTSYDAVYWLWRALKQAFRPRGLWQYGGAKRFLTLGELEAIYLLSANPVDNVRSTVESARASEEEFTRLCFIVAKQFLRYHRPWWRHPRWHVHHWRLQIHPWQRLRRRLFDRCATCGKPFGWNECPTAEGWGSKILHHSECLGHRVAIRCDVPEPTALEVGHG